MRGEGGGGRGEGGGGRHATRERKVASPYMVIAQNSIST